MKKGRHKSKNELGKDTPKAAKKLMKNFDSEFY